MGDHFTRPINLLDNRARGLAFFCLAGARTARAIGHDQKFRGLSFGDCLKDLSRCIGPIKNQQCNGCGELKV
jgi:hypothetical protein